MAVEIFDIWYLLTWIAEKHIHKTGHVHFSIASFFPASNHVPNSRTFDISASYPIYMGISIWSVISKYVYCIHNHKYALHYRSTQMQLIICKQKSTEQKSMHTIDRNKER